MLFQTQGDSIYNLAKSLYPELKFWGSLGGIAFAVSKGLNWLKTIKTNDLHHIQIGVTAIEEQLKDQNTNIVNGLKELRTELHDDLRELTIALLSK